MKIMYEETSVRARECLIGKNFLQLYLHEVIDHRSISETTVIIVI
ncbi:unnamed protein product [Arabidopsis halleri]